MNTKEVAREQISAFADGEVADAQAGAVLAALREPQARADWDVYHHIGDVLRSDDMAVTMSVDFSARMAAALEREPAIVAPAERVRGLPAAAMPRRWAMPGMVAAAAVAAVAFITTPQLLVAMKSEPAIAERQLASAGLPVNGASAMTAAAAPEGTVLRDARIDDYLLAHQRFSPSVYSTAQYARSATFANDTNK
jgi:sigma-E factor negative regulatory protein RseA